MMEWYSTLERLLRSRWALLVQVADNMLQLFGHSEKLRDAQSG